MKAILCRTNGLILVIDSSDTEGFENTAENLKILLEEEELKNCPVLILSNKKDSDKHFTDDEIKSKLENKIPSLIGRQWKVQGCIAFYWKWNFRRIRFVNINIC